MQSFPSCCIRGLRPSIKSSRLSILPIAFKVNPFSPTRCRNPTGQSIAYARSLTTVVDAVNVETLVNEDVSSAARFRATEIRARLENPYPRISGEKSSLSCEEFRTLYGDISSNKTVETESVVLRGRISSIRSASSKLLFLDLVQAGAHVQILCNYRSLSGTGLTTTEFNQFSRLAKRGDIYSVSGNPHRTSRGELSLKATTLPTLLSPCLHDFPEIHTAEGRDFPDRHVELLLNSQSVEILQCRSTVIHHLREFLHERSYSEVQTPILAAEAGGATARPFNTSATEFEDRKLSLRIAPELWLKRLILGGLEKVFEIGPSFRNEGIDKNHNPEFTTCEFYAAFADLEDLIFITEDLICELRQFVLALKKTSLSTIQPPSEEFTRPFKRLEFIPTIERDLGCRLPDLFAPDAFDSLSSLLRRKGLSLPLNPTLPRLLDKLSSICIEPQCQEPTFIIHHPECLSPLSKSFTDPNTQQRVAARAELFAQGQEIVNLYEEENSPFEQRRKFLEQRAYREEGSLDQTNEAYLRALEWGLPPTGGWGCGIDRLCMFLTGATKISDVLSFGNLRAVTRNVDSTSVDREVDVTRK